MPGIRQTPDSGSLGRSYIERILLCSSSGGAGLTAAPGLMVSDNGAHGQSGHPQIWSAVARTFNPILRHKLKTRSTPVRWAYKAFQAGVP
jgi:hypothetical protein